VWAEAPAKPYHTITFNKNDGTGAFEKRIAVPTETLYETIAEGPGDGLTPKTITVDGVDKTIYVTEEKNAGNKKDGGLVFYEDYKIQATDYSDNMIKQNEGALIPVFTREHYKEDAVWKDINDKTVSANDSATTYDGDTQLYHQWTAKTFTVTFDLNKSGLDGNISDLTTSLNAVDEALSAEGGLAKADKTLPVISAELTKGSDPNKETYKFAGWYADADGIQLVGNNTSLYPKDENSSEITLYAKWALDGYQLTFSYKDSVQTWTVPKDGTYRITAYGAGRNYGLGGNISGEIDLTAGTPLYVYVGGQGEDRNTSANKNNYRKGGWNGGGDGGKVTYQGGAIGGGGHGASDVRVTSGNWDNADSLASRIIVAGGGGGNGGNGSNFFAAGAGGSGIANGGDSSPNTDNKNKVSKGGEFTATDGSSPGKGGAGVTLSSSRGGSGGGSGYYGGGIDTESGIPSGGGGGSSWAAVGQSENIEGLYFNEGTITPSTGAAGGGTNDGHGRVELIFVKDLSSE
jgi:uncharacterized repeat protein (TIGR02543 family)